MKAAEEINEVLTKTIRKVNPKNLTLECVSYHSGVATLGKYSMPEVVADYGTYSKPLDALLEVLHKSDCPLVAAYREALAAAFADAHADELDLYLGNV